jgi:alpha-glucoside transport system permease protein
LTTLEEPEAEDLAPPDTGERASAPTDTRTQLQRIAIAAVVVGVIILAILFDKIRSTIITTVVAVAVCAAIWIGANLLFDQVRSQYQRFLAISFGLCGALLGVLLHGNRITVGSGEGFLTWVIGPALGFVLFGALGFFLAQTDDVQQRRIAAIGGAAVAGVVVGLLIREQYYPGVDWLTTVIYTAIGLVVGAGLAVLFKRPPLHGALVLGALGWLLGYWGGADLGDGNIATSVLGCVVPAVMIGAWISTTTTPNHLGKTQIDVASRKWIFLGPAVLFIMVMLVVPAIRTAYLSLLDDSGDEFVGLDNYNAIRQDKNSLNLTNWTNMFTSWPFYIAVVLLAIALVVGISMKRQTGRAVEIGNPTGAPLVAGLLFLAFAAFTAMRGTIINNLWWVVVVVFFATGVGLAVAVLADNAGGERIAKSIIFMPMAISLVGASIIWRFMYQTRDVSQKQTGVMNALWVGIGRLSTGSGIPTILGAVLLGLLLVVTLAYLARSLVRRAYGRAVVPAVLSIFALWFFVRYTQIIGGGAGGFRYLPDGQVEGQTIAFVQETPYNNFWLMVILVWIQVGFAMVILSAAIKAVPDDLIEAAKMDGATNSQVFWRVTLPQIATTIGVVVTTLIVLVMKVFDIVKVTTNGQFDTQVLANDMFNQAFNNFNIGTGAALAILILVSVLPVMYYNIRKMQKEA